MPLKKTLFLILTLAIPVSIFLFLKFFGSNTFEVPILFENGIPACPQSIGPHKIPEMYFKGPSVVASGAKGDSFKVLGVVTPYTYQKYSKLVVQLVRIQDAFYEVGSPYFVLYSSIDDQTERELGQALMEQGMSKENFAILAVDSLEMREFVRCGIGLNSEKEYDLNRLVLVDRQNHIRGMYKSLEMSETDQLILELKILKTEI